MNSTSSRLLLLPIVTVQPTFSTVISEVDSGIIPFDNFWISCYKETFPSVHSKIHVRVNEINRDVVDLEPDDTGVQIRTERNSYTVACPALDIPHTRIILPEQEYADGERADPQRPHRITAFDVSPDGSQFATGFHDGSVYIYPVFSTPEFSIRVKRTSKPHLSTVTSLRFFPSSQVLLTAGADFAVTVLPADLPSQDANTTMVVSPVRTLRGHTRSITSTGIISRGRNVLSCSKDGTIRLWDVSNVKQLHMLIAGKGKYTPVSSMCVGERVDVGLNRTPIDGDISNDGAGLGDESHVASSVKEGEVDTTDKMVFCALGDGTFEILDLRTKTSIFQSTAANSSTGSRPAALTSIAYSPSDRLLATGSTDGIVTVFDVRSLTDPLTSFYRNSSSIEDLAFCSPRSPSFANDYASDGKGLIVAPEDGLPYIAGIHSGGVNVRAEIVGGDCDAVRVVRTDEKGCNWTASDDGIVRKYREQ